MFHAFRVFTCSGAVRVIQISQESAHCCGSSLLVFLRGCPHPRWAALKWLCPTLLLLSSRSAWCVWMLRLSGSTRASRERAARPRRRIRERRLEMERRVTKVTKGTRITQEKRDLFPSRPAGFDRSSEAPRPQFLLTTACPHRQCSLRGQRRMFPDLYSSLPLKSKLHFYELRLKSFWRER